MAEGEEGKAAKRKRRQSKPSSEAATVDRMHPIHRRKQRVNRHSNSPQVSSTLATREMAPKWNRGRR